MGKKFKKLGKKSKLWNSRGYHDRIAVWIDSIVGQYLEGRRWRSISEISKWLPIENIILGWVYRGANLYLVLQKLLQKCDFIATDYLENWRLCFDNCYH